jgi:Txe/YoeB family toxin of Txe-Axe toxin-antitoxin module
MGRLARYKKVKDCDPFSKKNGGRVRLDTADVWGLGDSGRKPKKRSKTSEKLRARKKRKRTTEFEDGFDVPPGRGDDFDLADLVGSLKKEEPVRLPTAVLAATPVSSTASAPTHLEKTDEEVQESKLLKVDKQIQKKPADVVPEMGRMEGETKKAYHRRVKAETRQIIKEQRISNRNPEKKQRKKEFLNNKKKKKKNNRGDPNNPTHDSEDESDNQRLTLSNDSFVTGEQALAARALETAVKFGEQAERPPSFRQLPRGASKKSQTQSSTRLVSSTQIAAEQEAMEMVRRKVQAQYAAIKYKRRLDGDFHL